MVKLRGPALATEASGQLAGQLIFSTWKGTRYLKRHRKPKQPRSPAQVAMRAMMAFLSESWPQIPQDRRDTWLDLAAASNITPFNAYQAYNLQRWTEHRNPSQSYPATETSEASSFQGYHTTGMPRAVEHRLQHDYQMGGWGWRLHTVEGPLWLCRWDNLIHLVLAPSPGIRTWIQRNMEPGTHYHKCKNFSIDGRHGYTSTLQTAVVTN